MADPGKLRVAVIGAGRVAGGYDEGRRDGAFSHAGAYRADGGYELLVCVEPDAERRARFLERWAIPYGYPDLESWIASGPAVDVVSVCTPDETHGDILSRLLDVPVKAVWTEKPLATDLSLARRVCEGFAARDVPVAVNYLRRWDSAMTELRGALGPGDLGAVQSAVVHYGKGFLHNGSHAIDLLRFLLGPLRPAWVRRTALTRDLTTLDAVLLAPNGAAVYLAGTDDECFTVFELSLVTERARIDILDSGLTICERRVADDAAFAGYRKLGRTLRRPTALGAAMTRAAGNLREAVRCNAPLACSATDALETLESCFDIMAASEAAA